MNTNETKVDVLGALREFATKRDPFGSTDEAMRKYIEARDALAELIEADREYDEANSDWDQVTSRDPDEADGETWRRVSARFEAAVMRRVCALDRIGGAE